MTKPTLITLFSLAFAASTVACASAPPPPAAAPAPQADAAELALLGLGPGASTNQITPEAKPAPGAAKDDGADIVPPFPGAKPAKSGPAKKAPGNKGNGASAKKTASR